MPASPSGPLRARRASPRSRPGRRRDGRSADAGCRAGGRPRTAAGSAPRAPPPAGRSRAWRPTSARISTSMPSARQPRAGRPRFRGRFGAQAVIDDQRQHTAVALCRPNRCASSASASESRPPETATARTGRASNGAKGAIRRRSAGVERRVPASPAAVLLALLVDPPLLQVGGARIVLIEAWRTPRRHRACGSAPRA